MDQLTFWHFTIIFVGSFLAGVINTFAGNGSVITLSLLTDLLGLPGNMANGTNRVGVILQSAASAAGFQRNKVIDFSRAKHILVLMMIGAIFGVYVVTKISNEQFLFVFRYLMVIMLVVVLVKPERWLQATKLHNTPVWISVPVFLSLGFYGGFIQMGMGIFFLAFLVLISKYSIVDANAIKTIIVFLYTCIILVIFAWKGLVDWKIGILLAVGQSLGGYLTALYGPRYTHIAVWAYRFLVTIIILSILSQFNVLKLLS